MDFLRFTPFDVISRAEQFDNLITKQNALDRPGEPEFGIP
jgi:hypothetical protein